MNNLLIEFTDCSKDSISSDSPRREGQTGCSVKVQGNSCVLLPLFKKHIVFWV